ncbi:unnamed protein product [Brassica rapa]|uniref:Beta-galactosidase n=1 Tax=Brassica campestris TaxID=3711 RepID=A0A8D9D6F6_BRACM|nr:unnamed protein product [Brassica rapa]
MCIYTHTHTHTCSNSNTNIRGSRRETRKRMVSGRCGSCWIILAMVLVLSAAGAGGATAEKGVTYDGRSLIIDGQRKLLFSGSIHYPRSTPEMWPSLIKKTKEGGIEVIDTYVFWNLHEPKLGQYDFNGRNDLVKFIKEIRSQGLYVCLRIGPFIEAEWNYGGLPFWLRDVPGMVYRTDNEPFKFHMRRFTSKIVNLLKLEGLYASQGGPIILSQIENEYGNVQAAFREKGASYVKWAAKMAVGLQTGVPWIMCKQPDAPDPVINTCNGMRCGETFPGPNSPNKPKMWTEDWTSFFQVYGAPPYIRSAEDIAYHAALFVAKNGSFINYYMYHGGTNFGRTSSSYFITGYYDQAPLDEYGLLRQPKYGHLKELHAAIKSTANPLLHGKQTILSLGPMQQAYVFEDARSGCVAFLVNNDGRKVIQIQFRNNAYSLRPKSIGILQNCKTLIYETAKVNVPKNMRVTTPVHTFNVPDKWEVFRETIPTFSGTSLRANTLLEHTKLTKDKTDYLWYTLRFKRDSTCMKPSLFIESSGHVVHVFVNNALAGSGHGSRDIRAVKLQVPVGLINGQNNISILSGMVGLPDSGAYMESKSYGLTKAQISCDGTKTIDLSRSQWGYSVGLLGEKVRLHQWRNLKRVKWSNNNAGLIKNHPLAWYKTMFDAPSGDGPVGLNMESMGKGEMWVNGESIGRYWVSFLTPSGHPSQSIYHIPRAFLKPSGNFLVVLEEEGGDPLGISLNTISVVGLPRLPKWGHLKNLHKAIMLSENMLIGGEHRNFSLGPSLEADVYTSSSGSCAAFLSNSDDKNDKTAVFQNMTYHLPAWSVSILPDCKNEVFNTAKVTAKSSKVEMLPEDLKSSSGLKWQVFSEKPGIWGEADFVKNELVDHINTTKDTTDYLWYTTSITISANEGFLKKQTLPVLFIESKGHTLHIFINKEYIGTATGNGTHVPFKLKKSVPLKAGENNIDLLSMTVGLSNAGSFYEWVPAGLTSVSIKGLNNGTLNLTHTKWTYKLGVEGEHLSLFKPGNSGAVKWTVTTKPPKKQPLTWYKVVIDPPSGSEPVGLDMISMGKGMAWLNGEEIGRYWPRIARKNAPNDECVKECDYRGKFMPDKCNTGCGEPSQRWYHVPRSWFKSSGNELVIFEEKGGYPTKIKLSRRKVTEV